MRVEIRYPVAFATAPNQWLVLADVLRRIDPTIRGVDGSDEIFLLPRFGGPFEQEDVLWQDGRRIFIPYTRGPFRHHSDRPTRMTMDEWDLPELEEPDAQVLVPATTVQTPTQVLVPAEKKKIQPPRVPLSRAMTDRRVHECHNCHSLQHGRAFCP